MKQRVIYTLAILFAIIQATAQRTTKYEYDDLNRLTKVTYANGSIVSFTYDELGNRLSKNVNAKVAGDVTGSGKVEVQDATTVVNYILGTENNQDYDYNLADMNNDGEVDVFDVTTIINVILGKNSAASRSCVLHADDPIVYHLTKAKDMLTIGDFKIAAGETKKVDVSLSNDEEYVAFQFDLYLPEGVTVEDHQAAFGRMPESTTLSMSKQADGSYRFLAAAMKGEPIVGNNGTILTLTVKAPKDLAQGEKKGYFRLVKLAKADATGPTYQEMTFTVQTVPSSIGNILATGEPFDIYTPAGVLVRSQATTLKGLPRGVYIVNNQKIILK